MTDNIYILIFYSVTAVFLIIIFFLFLHIRNQNTIWKQRKEFQENEILQQKQLLNAVIESQEKERKRIGEDLHDEIGGTLSAIKLMLNAKKNIHPDEDTLSPARALIDKMIVDVRNISHDLSPPGLAMFGLYSAIEAFITIINHNAESIIIHIAQEPAEAFPRLTERSELALFRVITQLVSNTIKHAVASQIRILFKAGKEQLEIVYQDNGGGFDPDILKKQQGMGIQNMKSRLQMIHADYMIETAEGRGFKMIITLDHKHLPGN